LKKPLETAVKLALRYVEAGIRTGPDIGHGYRPLNHFHSLQAQEFAPYDAAANECVNCKADLLETILSNICLNEKTSNKLGEIIPTTIL